MLLMDEDRAYYKIKEICNDVARTQAQLKGMKEGTTAYEFAAIKAERRLCELCTVCRVFWFDECALFDWVTLHGEGCFDKTPIEEFVDLFHGTFGKARDVLEKEFNHRV